MLGSDADAAPNASEPFQLRHISSVVMDLQYDDEEPSEDEKQRDRLAKQLKKQRKLEKKARKEKEQKELEAAHDKEAVAPSQSAEEKQQPRSTSRAIMALHARIVAEQEQRQKDREALSFSTQAQVPSPAKTSPVSASVESDWVDQIQDTCKNGSSLKFEPSTSSVAGTFASNGIALVTEKLAERAKGIEVLSSLLRSSLSTDTPADTAESSGNAGTSTACATHCEQRADVEGVGSAVASRERSRDEPTQPAVRHGLQRRELSAISAPRPVENRHPSSSSAAVCVVKEEPLANRQTEAPPSTTAAELAKAADSRFIRETPSACRSPRRESRCPYTGLAHSMCCASSSPETEFTVGSHHTSYGTLPADHFVSTEDLVSGGRVSLKEVALDRWPASKGQPGGMLQEIQVKVQHDEHELDGLGRTEACDQPMSTFSLNWSCFMDGYRVRL